MNLQDLLEAPPDFLDKEMPIITISGTLRFYSEDTIKREFDIIGTGKLANETFWVILKKDRSFAVIGILGKRKEDSKIGIQILGKIDFKENPDFSFNKLIHVNNNVLQVDSVEIYDNKFQGLGFNLYQSLVEHGYIIVSDHTQYRGGRKLWEKISKLSNAKKYSVYVVNNGKVTLDVNDKPLRYDGTNLADDKIWAASTNKIADSRRYVLLLMKKN